MVDFGLNVHNALNNIGLIASSSLSLYIRIFLIFGDWSLDDSYKLNTYKVMTKKCVNDPDIILKSRNPWKGFEGIFDRYIGHWPLVHYRYRNPRTPRLSISWSQGKPNTRSNNNDRKKLKSSVKNRVIRLYFSWHCLWRSSTVFFIERPFFIWASGILRISGISASKYSQNILPRYVSSWYALF